MENITSFFSWIDTRCLHVFQRVSGKIQEVFGVSNLWLAKLCYKILFIAISSLALLAFYNGNRIIDSVFFIFSEAFFLFASIILCKMCDVWYERYEKGYFSNSHSDTFVFMRISALIISLVFTTSYPIAIVMNNLSFIDWISLIIFSFFCAMHVCGLYFFSCIQSLPKENETKLLSLGKQVI